MTNFSFLAKKETSGHTAVRGGAQLRRSGGKSTFTGPVKDCKTGVSGDSRQLQATKKHRTAVLRCAVLILLYIFLLPGRREWATGRAICGE